ncbi:MAG TPA: sigma-70 family RNA polymerase sigma factor [Verrucomicrobiales bacterium]|jgi:RNA polymerase sigma factor (sigma-70 family)|nr:sigma-70 family RNA polymerase sigma factor [Verrucomicrobiales bacterium]
MDTRPEDDARLLREFAAGQSQSAFRTLVERYQDMVYGTARRRMGNDQAASDVAQNVFAALARKAPWLSSRTSVGGWLYKSTLMEAARRQRDDLRRFKRERLYAEEMNIRGTNDHDEEAPQLRELMPVLDDAMSGLSAPDREALLLRYFRGLSLRDTGAAMGTTEEAARKRVSRAVEKLSGLFKRKGITVPAAAIAATLLPKAASQAAPVAFASKVTATAAALPAPGVAASLYMKTAALSKAQMAAVYLAAAAVPVTWQAVKIADLNQRNEALESRLASGGEVSSALREREGISGRFAVPGQSQNSKSSQAGGGSRSGSDREREHRGPKPSRPDLHELERRYQREARLTAMAERLGLNENQISVINAAMDKADKDRKALWESMMGPGKPPPDKAAMDAITKAQDATIAAVMQPDQQTAYEEFCAEEAQNRQEIFANRLLGEMQGGLHLNAEQKDKLFAVFAAQAAQAEGDPGPWAWAQTMQEGQKDKLKDILTADQFRLWQQRIDTWNKFFRPDKPLGERGSGERSRSTESK